MTLLDLPQVPLTVTHVHSDNGEILCVIGYVDEYTVPTLQPALLTAVKTLDQSKAGSLIIDLSCARYVDRMGLAMLLRVGDMVAGQDCTLVIRLRPGSQPESLLRTVKLDCLLTLQA